MTLTEDERKELIEAQEEGAKKPIVSNGGSAFPRINTWGEFDNGMAMRDWFAGQALQGFLAGGRFEHVRSNADLAYEQADAMIKARGE